jgi:ribosome-binding factor A
MSIPNKRRGSRPQGRGMSSDIVAPGHRVARGLSGHHKARRKDLQLCRQAARAISDGLAECMDDVLQSLVVTQVRPAPSAARLMVTVTTLGDDPIPAAEILSRLEEVRWLLRQEVAEAIHRRKVPSLIFQVAAS